MNKVTLWLVAIFFVGAIENGGLMAYGPEQGEPYRRTAAMIDKILKVTKPAGLPVEQPKKFEFVINLKPPSRSA